MSSFFFFIIKYNVDFDMKWLGMSHEYVILYVENINKHGHDILSRIRGVLAYLGCDVLHTF